MDEASEEGLAVAIRVWVEVCVDEEIDYWRFGEDEIRVGELMMICSLS